MLQRELDKLQKHLTGNLLIPGSDAYDSARKLFNGMIDKKPAAVVQCKTERDIVLALQLAQEYDLPFAIKSGGHGVAGNAICNKGIVVDFSLMRKIEVDPDRRKAKVQSGITWGEFDKACAKFSLATTGGIISSTGVAGLTLGGGIGWLVGKYGLSCDNLLGANIILANGHTTTVSDTEKPDLMWGLRGAGANFGVVTEFEFQLHPVQLITAGSVYFPIDQAEKVLAFYRDFALIAPDELTLSLILSTSRLGQQQIQIDGAYIGDHQVAMQTFEPLLKLHGIIKNTISPVSYEYWQTCFDDPYRDGRRSYWKPLFIDDFNVDFFHLLVEAFRTVPSPHTMLTFDHLHGAASRVSNDATAFHHRDKTHLLLINTNWDDPLEDEKNIIWSQDLFKSVENYSTRKAYVNYLGQDLEEEVVASYGEPTYQKLVQLKLKYDPKNFFCSNQNINPMSKIANG